MKKKLDSFYLEYMGWIKTKKPSHATVPLIQTVHILQLDSAVADSLTALRRYDMNGRFQMQGGKNRILPIEMNSNRFFWEFHWLEIWSNYFCPSMAPNGGSVAMDSGECYKAIPALLSNNLAWR
jgi:hypothetical protein